MSAPFEQRGDYKVVHMFAGSGGCTAGFDEDGFETIARADNGADATPHQARIYRWIARSRS